MEPNDFNFEELLKLETKSNPKNIPPPQSSKTTENVHTNTNVLNYPNTIGTMATPLNMNSYTNNISQNSIYQPTTTHSNIPNINTNMTIKQENNTQRIGTDQITNTNPNNQNQNNQYTFLEEIDNILKELNTPTTTTQPTEKIKNEYTNNYITTTNQELFQPLDINQIQNNYNNVSFSDETLKIQNSAEAKIREDTQKDRKRPRSPTNDLKKEAGPKKKKKIATLEDYKNPSLMICCVIKCKGYCHRDDPDPDMLECNACKRCIHVQCHTPPLNHLAPIYRKNWLCGPCKICETCKKPTQPEMLLICDKCDRAWHTFCHTPRINVLPNEIEGDWICAECIASAKERSARHMPLHLRRFAMINKKEEEKTEENKRSSSLHTRNNKKPQFSLCIDPHEDHFNIPSLHPHYSKTKPNFLPVTITKYVK
mmetsp:Transcript_9887/g.14574  ORF Transcript_9887/g.14574 Transcript_9887/m.14574 type:complete len:425 (+) Transcript_9887:69-1343(+)